MGKDQAVVARQEHLTLGVYFQKQLKNADLPAVWRKNKNVGIIHALLPVPQPKPVPASFALPHQIHPEPITELLTEERQRSPDCDLIYLRLSGAISLHLPDLLPANVALQSFPYHHIPVSTKSEHFSPQHLLTTSPLSIPAKMSKEFTFSDVSEHTSKASKHFSQSANPYKSHPRRNANSSQRKTSTWSSTTRSTTAPVRDNPLPSSHPSCPPAPRAHRSPHQTRRSKSPLEKKEDKTI